MHFNDLFQCLCKPEDEDAFNMATKKITQSENRLFIIYTVKIKLLKRQLVRLGLVSMPVMK